MIITVLCYGDSTNLNTWSNLPYFLCEGLIENGIEVNRVDMSRYYRFLKTAFDHSIFYLYYFFSNNKAYHFIRTNLYRELCKRVLKNVCSKYQQSDAFLLLSYDWDLSPYTDKPVVLFGDWTFDFEIRRVQKRVPGRFENKAIETQRNIIKGARRVFVTRQECRDELIKCELFSNVSSVILRTVNIRNEDKHDVNLALKYSSSSVVFLGAVRYLAGAISLIHAINRLNEVGLGITAYYVGISEKDLPENVIPNTNNVFKGYLRKSVDNERSEYYRVINSSKYCINTNPEFASIASIKEAMYLFTPAVVGEHYQSFSLLGDGEDGFRYCSNEVDDLYTLLRELFTIDYTLYKGMATAAHMHFEDYDWKVAMRNVIDDSGIRETTFQNK